MFFLIHTLTHTRTLALTLTHTRTLALTTLTHTHTHILTRSHSHTYILTHTHTHCCICRKHPKQAIAWDQDPQIVAVRDKAMTKDSFLELVSDCEDRVFHCIEFARKPVKVKAVINGEEKLVWRTVLEVRTEKKGLEGSADFK